MFLNYVVEIKNVNGRLNQLHYTDKDIAITNAKTLRKVSTTASVIVVDAKTSDIILEL